MVNKEEIIKESINMVEDSIMIGKLEPEHFEMPIRFALDRYEEELNAENKLKTK